MQRGLEKHVSFHEDRIVVAWVLWAFHYCRSENAMYMRGRFDDDMNYVEPAGSNTCGSHHEL